MSLSAGAISSGPSALNERLSLVEPQISPSRSNCDHDSAPITSASPCSPGSLGINKNSDRLAQIIHVAPSEFETERNFIGRGPMGDIWLSLVRCAPSNRRTHAAFRAFLWRFSEIGDSVAEGSEFELSVPLI